MSTGRAAQAVPIRDSLLRFALVAALLALASAVAPAAVRADEPASPPGSQRAAYSDRVETVIAAARAYLGTPYRVGTEGPSTIDCSGLVFRAFANAGELRQVGGARLRAAGYLRWFAARSLLTTMREEVERGDLVVYANGKHIGIYLGDGRVISALVTGVTVHSLEGITQPVTGFLAVDWTGKRGPFTPVVLPPKMDEPETPAALVPAAPWMPASPDPEIAAGLQDSLVERTDMRTANSRTFETSAGQFTTEIFSRPIFYLPEGTTEWQPIDLTFRLPEEGEKLGAIADKSPVSLGLRGSREGDALLTATSGETTVSLSPRGSDSRAAPEIAADSRFADYRDVLGPGVGLRILPRADGFKTFLVLASEPTTRRFDFHLSTAGLAPTVEPDGSVALRDASGALVGRFTKPMLLDSSDVDGDAAGIRADAVAFSLKTADDGSTRLSVTVEQAALDEAIYPAYVDLGLVDFPNATYSAAHTFVSSYHPNGNFSTFQRPESGYAELWHGRRPGRGDDNEGYLHFLGVAALLRGGSVETADLQVFPYWQTGPESPTQTWLGRITESWDLRSVTWNTRPDALLDAATYETTQAAWGRMDVAAYVRDVVGGAPDYGLVLHANGAGRGHWKRFVAESAFGDGVLEPRLAVTWSGLRPSVTTATVAAEAVDLGWTNAEVAPAANRIQLQLSRDGFATVARQMRLKSGPAQAGWVALPIADLSVGTYSWRARAKYGDATRWSPWSEAGTFTIGAIAAPKVVLQHGRTLGV